MDRKRSGTEVKSSSLIAFYWIAALCISPFLWLFLISMLIYRCAATLLAGRKYTLLSRTDALCGQELDSPNCMVNLVLFLECHNNVDANVLFTRFWEEVVMATEDNQPRTQINTGQKKKRFPNFSRCLSFKYGYLAWRDVRVSDMDPAQHLYQHPGGSVGSEEELQMLINSYCNSFLPADRPPWELVLIQLRSGWREPRYAGETVPDAVWLWRVNHSVIDGLSLIRILSEVLATNREVAEGALLRTIGPLSDWARLPNSLLERCKWYLCGFLNFPVYMLKSICSRDRGYLLSRNVTHRKNYVWSAPISMSSIRTAKKVASVREVVGFTINEVLMSCVAGALGKFLASQFAGRVPGLLHVNLPVSYQEIDKPVTDGSKVINGITKLPTGEGDPLRRLHLTKKYSDDMKALVRSGVPHLAIRLVGYLFTRPLYSSAAALGTPSTVFSNVAGPPLQMEVCGFTVVEFVGFAPNNFVSGLSLAITTYCNSFVITVVMDTGIGEHLEIAVSLVQMVQDHLKQLERSVMLPSGDDQGKHEVVDEKITLVDEKEPNFRAAITSIFESIDRSKQNILSNK